jgi:hypothetical protein
MTGSRYATFIDAGLLRSVFAQAVIGLPAARVRVEFDPTRLDEALRMAAARACPHSTITRHFFYDASSTRFPAPSHDLIARHGNFSLRLGKIKDNGQQKGVDTMLALDMALKARDRLIDDVILVGADYDLYPGFEAAKSMGARVHLIDLRALGAAPCRELYLAADSVIPWSLADVAACATTTFSTGEAEATTARLHTVACAQTPMASHAI